MTHDAKLISPCPACPCWTECGLSYTQEEWTALPAAIRAFVRRHLEAYHKDNNPNRAPNCYGQETRPC